MIDKVEIPELKMVYKEVSLLEYLEEHAGFELMQPVYSYYASCYNIPKDKNIVSISNNYRDIDGNEYEHDFGYIILETNESFEKYKDLEHFCIFNKHRIINVDSSDR